MTSDAPKNLAKTTSRTSPRMRDSRVIPLTTDVFAIRRCPDRPCACPPAPGEEYHLWFMTEDGKIDGGTIDVRSDTSSEREAMSMPDGTEGFVVTLERPRQDDPESLTVLLGEKPINL